MEQYIPKSALVAKIERIKENANKRGAIGKVSTIVLCNELLSFLDTFEVKEVNLEKYYHDFLQKEWFGNLHVRTISEMMAFTAKHFFELGLKAQKGEEV